MTSTKSNPAPLETVAGLGNVATGQVIDIARNTSPHHLRQVAYLSTRFGLLPSRARLVASLALGVRIVLSAALEHLAEKEIDCLEAAAFYSLSALSEWQAPALEWLKPVAETWWRDWARARPAIGRLAAHCDDLPVWLTREARS